MKKYYIERNGLIKRNLQINIKELLSYFYQIYEYFTQKGYFKCAINGIRIESDGKSKQILPPLLSPSAEIFFTTRLQNKKIYPIDEYYQSYQEETLFAVIEILYDYIGDFDFETKNVVQEKPKQEFCEHINNILRFYKTGYYLEPQNGFIMEIPNEALKKQLEYDGSDMEDEIYQQLSVASTMYYRFDSNEEIKKKAINILADILEKVREDVKVVLNTEYQINKTKHDALIFDIVNNYNIRHNKDNQKTNYSKEIWYDWMMQYYTSTIITYYKLKKKYEEIN